ncbi:MAG: type II secretion system minor pseudopilin GspK [Thermodesulfobacteriota bacterium]|nr:type II secretion system minor pseudopilin GspK [Thermodesulfobacteriota bacterium]
MIINIVKDSKGVVLVLVLSIVALFTVMVLEFSSNQVTDIEMAYNFRDTTQAYYLTKAGIEAAKVLLKEDDPSYDSLDEDWANFSEYAMFAATFLGGPSFTGTLTDECSKMDFNSLVTKDGQRDEFRIAQLKRLFRNIPEIDIGEDELSDLIDAIVDWIDTDDNPTGFGGAEDDYYQRQEPPYECKDGPMDTPEEVLLVFKGISKSDDEYKIYCEYYNAIRNYVTVGTGGKININTASREVLLSLSEFINEDVVDSIMNCRPLTSEKDIYSCIEGIDFNVSEKDQPEAYAEMAKIKDIITIISSRFLVDVKGTMPSGAELNLKAVLERKIESKGIKVQTMYYRIY